MSGIMEKIGEGIGYVLGRIFSGIVTLLESLVLGVFGSLESCVGGGNGGSECSQTETEVVEQRIVMHRDSAQQGFHEQMLSMTRHKSDVQFDMLRPEMDSVISQVVYAYHMAMNDDEFKPLITSANDYDGHAEKSAHYVGAALDFRIKDMGNVDERKQLAQTVRENLGNRFVVLHEDVGQENEHLHVQLRNGTYNKNVVWK